MKKKFKAAGVYVSAGGPTLGISNYLEVVAHLTDGGFGYDTRHYNFPEIEEFTKPERWPELDVDYMYCAPPCAAFSSLGGRGIDWENNPKIQKAFQSLEIGLGTQPTIWMMESVTGFYRRGRSFIERAEELWMEQGYQITHFITGGILHGVPQRRIRWHMFAHKVNLVFPTFLGPKVRTMREAFDYYGPAQEGLGQMKSNERVTPLQKYAQDGCKYRDVYTWLTGIADSEVGLYSGVPHFSLRRGEWDRSVPTLVGTPRVYMPKPLKRLYSVGEGLVMCGYPSEFTLVARNTRDAYDQISKGILPPLANYLGSVVKASLTEGVKVKRVKDPIVVDWSDKVRAVCRETDNRIPRMDEALFGSKSDWLVRKRDA